MMFVVIVYDYLEFGYLFLKCGGCGGFVGGEYLVLGLVYLYDGFVVGFFDIEGDYWCGIG